jgi:hypothetical protein
MITNFSLRIYIHIIQIYVQPMMILLVPFDATRGRLVWPIDRRGRCRACHSQGLGQKSPPTQQPVGGVQMPSSGDCRPHPGPVRRSCHPRSRESSSGSSTSPWPGRAQQTASRSLDVVSSPLRAVWESRDRGWSPPLLTCRPEIRPNPT